MHLLRLPATSVKSMILLQNDQGPSVDPEQRKQLSVSKQYNFTTYDDYAEFNVFG